LRKQHICAGRHFIAPYSARAVENLRTFRDVLFMLRELDREQRANVVGERRREFAALSTGRSWLHSWAAEIHGK
jgi:hypothetical protein